MRLVRYAKAWLIVFITSLSIGLLIGRLLGVGSGDVAGAVILCASLATGFAFLTLPDKSGRDGR